jgi:hypothetical protein
MSEANWLHELAGLRLLFLTLHHMKNWKPIKTAPKNDTPIDLWHPEYGRLPNYYRVEKSRTNVFYSPVESGFSVVREATHWMPIPLPPSADA